MAPDDRYLPRDAVLVAQAATQQRNITRQQLIGLGLDDHGIDRRPWLYRVHDGVYSVGGPPRTGLEHAAAALLACGDRSALSHGSAMTLWGMWNRWELPINVTVPGDRRPRKVKVHKLRGLAARDLRVHRGLQATSPARTLLDMAPTMPDKSLRRRVNDARRAQLLCMPDIADVVERFAHHPGARRLKPSMEVKGGPTRSEWEDAFPAWCKRHGLPEPIMSAIVAGYEVDALFPDEKVIVELDSWEFHQSRQSFESDRNRDADTAAAGYLTLRITWGRLTKEEAARLHQILRQRRRSVA